MQNMELKTADPALAFESFNRTFANYMETNDERIRQIEDKALKRLKSPEKIKELEAALEN